VALAWQDTAPDLAREVGLGHYRGMAARMRVGQPAYDPGISEEDYVARALAITKDQMDRGLLTEHDGQRLARTEAYAHLRYREFMAGRVGSL
jgi:hypothetical protein